MFRCEYCGKEVKTKQGLTRHMNSCKEKDTIVSEEISEVGTEFAESKKEKDVIVSEDILEVGTEFAESKVEDKIKKLLDLRKSTFDAKTRHDIDLEIKQLRANS